MPEEKQPVEAQYLNLDDQPFKFGGDDWSDTYALNVVQQLFPVFENFRSYSHDNRWNTSDALFCAYKDPKVWEGSNVPRASLGIPVVFQQIESTLPALYNALFGIGPEWFQIEAEPGTDPQEARAVQASMSYLLEHSRDNFSTSAKTELKLSFLDMCMKGNGGIEIYWDPVIKRPCVRYVDLRDFYIDPDCPSPDVEECRGIFRRKMLTVDQIQQLRGAQGFNIPEDAILNALAKSPPNVYADQNKRAQEAYRNVNFTPNSTGWIPTPQDKKIEVLIYYSKNRIVWVLNRLLTVYNEINPYGFYPFAFAPCYIFPSRFYALSMADGLEGYQRYTEALLNARLDEVSLLVRPPRVMKRGLIMTPSQQKWAPGAVYQVDNAKEDMQLLQPQNALQNVYTEINYLDQQAEKQTGVSGMAQGVPKGGNVNRTATGVNAQMSGSNNRLQDLVSNIEDYLIVPMLYKLYKIIQYHTQPNDQLPAMTTYGNFAKIPASLYQKPIKFRMNAASRMVSKQTLQQILPFISQYLLNGQMMGAINGVGKTVDFNEYLQLMQDATGISRIYNLIRDLTDQEKQQMQQQQQQNPETVKNQQDYQARMSAIQTKAQSEKEATQAEIQKAQIMKGDPQQQMQVEQMKFQMEQQKMQFEMQLKEKEFQLDAAMQQMKAQADIKAKSMMAQIEQEAQKQSNFLDIQKKGADIQVKQQDNAMKLKQMALEHGQNMQISQQEMGVEAMKAQMGMQQSQMQHEQSLKHTEDSHSQGLEHSKQMGQEKIKLARAGQTQTAQKHPNYGKSGKHKK